MITHNEIMAKERKRMIEAAAKTMPSTVNLKIQNVAIMWGCGTEYPRKVKNALIEEMMTMMVRRNFHVPFTSLKGILADR
jgi:hypothetical protein